MKTLIAIILLGLIQTELFGCNVFYNERDSLENQIANLYQSTLDSLQLLKNNFENINYENLGRREQIELLKEKFEIHNKIHDFNNDMEIKNVYTKAINSIEILKDIYVELDKLKLITELTELNSALNNYINPINNNIFNDGYRSFYEQWNKKRSITDNMVNFFETINGTLSENFLPLFTGPVFSLFSMIEQEIRNDINNRTRRNNWIHAFNIYTVLCKIKAEKDLIDHENVLVISKINELDYKIKKTTNNISKYLKISDTVRFNNFMKLYNNVGEITTYKSEILRPKINERAIESRSDLFKFNDWKTDINVVCLDIYDITLDFSKLSKDMVNLYNNYRNIVQNNPLDNNRMIDSDRLIKYMDDFTNKLSDNTFIDKQLYKSKRNISSN
ncbi:MAG: hypothetical protein JJU28_07515 [Cyclobacteriaceae bacterium]|nr:hypothetical protein [Cyclobacteriaceae bacterium]